jgi:hypothetical protein
MLIHWIDAAFELEERGDKWEPITSSSEMATIPNNPSKHQNTQE